MRLLFFVIACLVLHYSKAQLTDSANARLYRILPDFPYRQEIKNSVWLPGGDFIAGRRTGADSISLGGPVQKSVSSFFLAKFEVRNKDYRQFVHYVRDSIVHSFLGHFIKDGNSRRIDWAAVINWKDERLDPLMLVPEERIFGRKELDVTKLCYQLSSGEKIPVYPDTLVWIRDFAYSYNEPMTKRYYSHPAFGNYPVVGVNQLQAMAYCDWKSREWNNALAAMNESSFRFEVRLPGSDEWEYAAQAHYPLSVTDTTQTKSYSSVINDNQRTKNNGFSYNFGKFFTLDSLLIKSYYNDGFFYTAPGNTYKPDSSGFYNLIGNVAEWTSTRGSYRPVYTTSGNNEELAALKKKFPRSPFAVLNEKEIDAYLQQYAIVKGGSWCTDDVFYLEPGANQYEVPGGTGHCYLGFRIAFSLVGTGR
ncbi:MAG TPA: SUMF1/EgtB/PvdO family nonheme iron enzyme [Chitinophagaceae bacterium]|nr:SUMF1/EgtB/PvdO family nonheme iron enzyme [Chitinophagaceae bacterium]